MRYPIPVFIHLLRAKDLIDREFASAYEFYTQKLGFHVNTDARMDDFRWLTMSPPKQPDHENILLEPGPPMIPLGADQAAVGHRSDAAGQLGQLVQRHGAMTGSSPGFGGLAWTGLAAADAAVAVAFGCAAFEWEAWSRGSFTVLRARARTLRSSTHRPRKRVLRV